MKKDTHQPGMYFISKFCEQCRHEKFMHTQKDDDKKCDILSRSMTVDQDNDNYPKELTFNEDKTPICTMYKHHNWRDVNDDIVEPEEEETIDPDQLSMF